MKNSTYYKNEQIEDMAFPDVGLRHIGHMVREVKPIANYRAVVDRTTDRTFAIVKSGYMLLPHEEVLQQMDALCAEFPEYGKPTRELWMSNYGGRMKARWTFADVDFEIGKLSDGTPDTVHPTMETFASYDTTLAHLMLLGGFRTVCSNGMVVGKVLSRYKKKHTSSLDIQSARSVLTQGMKNYSEAVELWLSYKNRNASMMEINCYESIGFNKEEKLSVEMQIKRKGKVKKWDDENPENRKVELNAWGLMNVLTKEATHRVKDINRQLKIQEKIARSFGG